MEHPTPSTSPDPFSGEDWFDPLEEGIRFRIRGFIEAMVEEELQVRILKNRWHGEVMAHDFVVLLGLSRRF